MSEKIITITREFGSGGRTIGKKVAQKLGIPCYDEELLEKMVKESGFVKEYIEEQSEDSVGWLNSILSYNGLTMTNQDKLCHSTKSDLRFSTTRFMCNCWTLR